MKVDFDGLVSSVYDCAANPELWPDTLSLIRDALRSAYVVVGFIDMSEFHSGKTRWLRKNSPCDEVMLERLQHIIHKIPFAETLARREVDESWTQLSHISESEFHRSSFYNEWVKPQKFRDTLNLQYLRRNHWLGTFGSPTADTREPVNAQECRLAEMLSPHIRRAILINELVDKSRLQTMLYRRVLNSLSVSAFIIGAGSRLIFTNESGEQLLSQAEYVKLRAGVLQSNVSTGPPAPLDVAIERALRGDQAVGISGIGVPLRGNTGDKAIAYVLPLAGSDIRGELGRGYCAVFIARPGEQNPMAMEILRTMFDFTVAEARVALALAKGEGPQQIADALGVSVHTVRSHLKHAYAKAGVADQTGLVALVNSLMPPIA